MHGRRRGSGRTAEPSARDQRCERGSLVTSPRCALEKCLHWEIGETIVSSPSNQKAENGRNENENAGKMHGRCRGIFLKFNSLFIFSIV